VRTLLVAAGAHTFSDPARAVVIDGERITWTGIDPAAAPPVDAAVDLGGAWLTPAFVDAHVHGTATGLALTGASLAGASSAAEALARLRAHARASDDGTLLGEGWDDFGWPEGRPMTAAEVRAAAPGRTVLLSRVDGHSCVVDPQTLARLPVERLAGVVRDDTGAPTGWLKEQASEAARRLVLGALPPARLAAARSATCRRAAELGIGSVHEMGHPGLSGLDDARAWAAGQWPIEALVWWAELDADASARDGLRPGGDLFLDGSIGSRTAAVSRPYADEGGTGELFYDDDAVAAFFSTCTVDGRGAGVHAIGDRAIAQALGALEAAAARHGASAVRRCRHRVEHLELAAPADADTLARLGAVASVQPAFDALWGGTDRLYAARFGAELALRTNPFAHLAAAGVPLAFGSDSPVTPLDPWGAVVAAERHRGGLGIERARALRAHTIGGRYVAGQDDVGPLRAGARADLALWPTDPLGAANPRALRCLATLVAGGVAHGDGEAVQLPSR
jgi:predicted amidohydrolase YtcJ